MTSRFDIVLGTPTTHENCVFLWERTYREVPSIGGDVPPVCGETTYSISFYPVKGFEEQGPLFLYVENGKTMGFEDRPKGNVLFERDPSEVEEDCRSSSPDKKDPILAPLPSPTLVPFPSPVGSDALDKGQLSEEDDTKVKSDFTFVSSLAPANTGFTNSSSCQISLKRKDMEVSICFPPDMDTAKIRDILDAAVDSTLELEE